MSSENPTFVSIVPRAGERRGYEVRPGTQTASALRWLAVLLAYFSAYLLVRAGMPGALDRDEAEIVYLTQQLRLGYGTQPPLYAWLQWLVFSVTGIDRFGLILPKAILLATAYVALYRASRPLVGRDAALAAAAMLALFPQIGWETLRIQTHSLLLLTLACAVLAAYVGLLGKPTLARYAWFGLLCGLGLQAKYNFGILLAGLVCASLLVPEQRRVLWNRRTWGALPAALLVVSPHAAWMLAHPDLAFGGTLRKMQAGNEGVAYLDRVLGGLADLATATLTFAALPACVLAIVHWRLHRPVEWQAHTAEARFFLCLYGSVALMLAALAFTGQVGTIKERWMMPLLFPLPLAAFVLLPALRSARACAAIRRAAVAAGLLFLALLPARTWLTPAFGMVVVPHHPYERLADALRRACPAAQVVVTESLLSAGNLRFARPELRTVLLDAAPGTGPPPSGMVLLVTHDEAGPGWQRSFHAAYPQAALLHRQHVRLARRFGSPGSMAFDVGCYRFDAS
ncbi:hypothetical protein HH212_13080 [Massilia forsythiae]|uniref:Glycosyltransferase RgtA/B/C/D-like domain-containing protein n=1 Tax=Massilia forsythiae TaxID=2728020 RepID=A0A7Z2VXC8_9BURK|nr:glycosyltransferase family 39 protein [Massilia forsythiae]QJE00840.1 hypothetical protein HH212_13080 [Massilia forsythiae]